MSELRERPADPPSSIGAAELAGYLTELGARLLSYGCSTQRLEELVRTIARIEGFEAQAFAIPTGLFVSVSGPDGESAHIRMRRVEDWAVDLDRLTEIDRILNDVVDRKLSIHAARLELRALPSRKPPYPLWAVFLASAISTAMSAVFFRGRLAEMAAAAVGGLCVSGLNAWLRRNPSARFLANFLGGIIAGALAWGASVLVPGLSREVVVLSVVILLVPGMTLTTGLTELTYKNLVSGTGRLMEAMVVFLSLIFGIALVVGVESRLGLSAPAVAIPPREPLGFLWNAGALLLASLSIGVLVRVPRRYLYTAVGSCGVGWVVTALASRVLPGHLTAFAASLGTCLFANALARATQRPSQVFIIPGLVLLVPGSFGFRSLESLLRGDFIGGASHGFEMFLIAGALVAGILAARVIFPPRKIL